MGGLTATDFELQKSIVDWQQLLDKELIKVDQYIKQLVKVETCDGESWILKQVEWPKQWAWWASIERELRARDTINMPDFLFDGGGWMAIRYIDGRVCRYGQLEESLGAVKALAQFHVSGYKLPVAPKKERPFLWSDRIRDRLYAFYNLLATQNDFSGVFIFLAKYGQWFYEEGLRSWEKLSQISFAEHCFNSREVRNINHRDLASHNWLIDKQDQYWLIDFDTADYDAPIGDLWQISSRILCEHDWSEQVLEQILNTYESIRPLTTVERRLFYLLLAFPNEFYRESLTAANMTDADMTKVDKRRCAYLQKLSEQRHKWQMLLKNL